MNKSKPNSDNNQSVLREDNNNNKSDREGSGIGRESNRNGEDSKELTGFHSA